MAEVAFIPTNPKKTGFNISRMYNLKGDMIESPIKTKIRRPNGDIDVQPACIPWGGRMRWTLNEDRKDEKKLLEYMRNAPECYDSPFLDKYPESVRLKVALYRIDDPEKEARGRLKFQADRRMAIQGIFDKIGNVGDNKGSVKDQDLLNVLAFTLAGVKSDKSNVIKMDAILTAAEKAPGRVLMALDDKMAKYVIKLAKLKEYGIIRKQGGFCYYIPSPDAKKVTIGNERTVLARLRGTKKADAEFQETMDFMLDEAIRREQEARGILNLDKED